jgi:hypothetical protein
MTPIDIDLIIHLESLKYGGLLRKESFVLHFQMNSNIKMLLLLMLIIYINLSILNLIHIYNKIHPPKTFKEEIFGIKEIFRIKSKNIFEP